MLPYIFIGVYLWISAVFAENGKFPKVLSAISLFVLIVFTGTRFEIGYDWLAYERYFQWVGKSFSYSSYQLSQTVLPVEYLFFVLNVVVNRLVGSFDFLLFIISAFNLIVIDYLIRKIDRQGRPFVWMMYFSLALIMVQFNIIRQSVASSFVIISLLLSCDNRRTGSLAVLLVAVLFHTSTLLFAPLIFLTKRTPTLKSSIVIVAISFAVLMAGTYVLTSLLSGLASFLPGEISAKTDSYATGFAGGNIWGISAFAAILIVFYLYLLYTFLRLEKDPYVNIAIWLTLLVLVAHIAFGQVPMIWNRVMCVSLPWQLAVYWSRYLKQWPLQFRLMAVSVSGLVTLSVFGYQLTRPENIAFVPYHSLLQVWATGDKGDGRVRSMYAVQIGDIEAARRAAQGGG